MRQLLFIILFSVASTLAGATQPIVSSIKPLQLLVTAITEDPQRSQLLLSPTVSPHHYQLRPSERRLLSQASLVVWVGPSLELFLQPTVAMLAPEQVLTLWPESGSGATPKADQHHHDHDHHHHDGDPHVWLDPVLLGELALTLANRLAVLDPASGPGYRQRALALQQQLQQLDASIRARLSGRELTGYLVAHDGYRHFEQRYGLDHVAAVTLTPERAPGAQHLLAIQRQIESGRVGCLFTEPQSPGRYLTAVMASAGVQEVTLDPLAGALPNNPQALLAFITGFSQTFLDCLLD